MTTLLDASQEVARFCLDRGLLDIEHYKQATLQSRESGRPIYDVLVDLRHVDDAVVKETMSSFLDIPSVDYATVKLPDNFNELIPKKFVLDNRIVPIAADQNEIRVVIAEPSALRSISSAKLITGKKVVANIISPTEMIKLLDIVQHDITKAKVVAGNVKASNTKVSTDDSNQVIAFVNNIIFDAVKQGASDIHIEQYKDSSAMRYRVDGVLHEQTNIKQFLQDNYSAVTTRLKIMSDMDIAERRLPQDGAIVITLPEGREIDLRVSVLPTVFGERVVMRILDRGGISFELEHLGFPDQQYKDVCAAFDAAQGMVLVTGPTGSGKSTTLYGALRRLNKPGVNILTAEDPVEFTIEGVGQVQIRDDIGLTFASALRSFLRQDPEIILVGEIRDKETADISIKASLTGHLVLSTLHANDAISTVVRLVNMGIPGYLIGSSLTLIIAQRLARNICQHCITEQGGDNWASLLAIGMTEEEALQAKPMIGKGCAHCNGTGYKGRHGIYEVLKVTDRLRAAIVDEASAHTLRDIAHEEGFVTMQQIGRELVSKGMLTIEEYNRNLIFN